MSQVQQGPVVHWRLECAICKEAVELEESKTDESGQAIHEACYVSSLTTRKLNIQLTRLWRLPTLRTIVETAHRHLRYGHVT